MPKKQKSSDPTVPQDLITRQQAAQLLNLKSPRMVDRLAADGRLQKYVLPLGSGRGGSRIRLSRSDVEQLRSPSAIKPKEQ